MRSAPLDGLRVLDASRLLPGPYCTRVLADLGAEVLRVDHPDPRKGDLARHLPPHLPGEGDGRSIAFTGLNHGKRSVALDLTEAEHRAHFLRLVERADVVVESFRPGTLDRLGLGWDDLHAANPAVILCSITGYGQDGPLAAQAGHDIGYLARAGVLGASGGPDAAPQPFGTQVADLAGGAFPAVIGILAALRERDGAPGAPGSGLGQHVDVSMTDGARALLALDGAIAGTQPEAVPARGANPLGGEAMACYRTYACADGYVALGALEPKFWQAWCRGVGRDDLIAAQGARPGSEQEQEVAAIFAARTRTDWEVFAAEHDCCLEVVKSPAEALADAPAHAVIEAHGPDGTPVRVPAPGIRFSRSGVAPGGSAPATGADQAWLEDLDAHWPAREGAAARA